jgi:hypothetical protein
MTEHLSLTIDEARDVLRIYLGRPVAAKLSTQVAHAESSCVLHSVDVAVFDAVPDRGHGSLVVTLGFEENDFVAWTMRLTAEADSSAIWLEKDAGVCMCLNSGDLSVKPTALAQAEISP